MPDRSIRVLSGSERRVQPESDISPGCVDPGSVFTVAAVREILESDSKFQMIGSLQLRDKAREIYWDLALERSGPEADMFPETILSYSPDTTFDCLCEVEKAVD